MKISYTSKNSYLEELQKINKEKRLEHRKELFEKAITTDEDKNKEEDSVILDISINPNEKGYQTANSSQAQLQKLYKKLKEYESKVSNLMKKLNFTDSEHEANTINEKIVDLNQKISAIKEQIQNIKKA